MVEPDPVVTNDSVTVMNPSSILHLQTPEFSTNNDR